MNNRFRCSDCKMFKKIPNVLTLLRVFLIPIYIVFFLLPYDWSNLAAALVFVIACFTDLLDGYLARKWNVCSKFGAFLDPVADKIMVCVALVMLVGWFSSHEKQYFSGFPIVLTICSVIIISREIVISALREWMAEIGKRGLVAVSWIGKWKTAIQMMSIAGLIWRDQVFIFRGNWMADLSLVLMLIATVLTLWSMVSYLIVGVKYMDD